MAELEIHHESEHRLDQAGQRVGLLAAALGALLAVVSIESHRAHTAAIIARTEANDAWQYYQARRIKVHNLELGQDLISTLGANSPAARSVLDRYAKERERYETEGKKTQEEARTKETEGRQAERKALRYDFAEGLLEVAVVLASLFFISRSSLFPKIAILAGVVGLSIAIAGVAGI